MFGVMQWLRSCDFNSSDSWKNEECTKGNDLEKSHSSNSGRFPWDLDAEMMMDEDEEAFDLWLRQALASGLFCESSKHRKSWSPFKLPQKKGKKQWRRTSC